MASSNSDSAEATEIDALLEKCRTAASQELLSAALEKLAAAIPPTTNEGRCDEIALFLIRNVVVIGASTTVSLDKCLDACGPESTLGACSQTILEAASIKIESPCPLETCFRTIKRLLLTIPEKEDDSLWLQSFNDTRSATRSDKILMKASMDNIVSTALLIPSQIANACHFQLLVLPAWSVRSRYIPRLVECALAINKQQSCPAADVYLQMLVQTIVHNGASDEVAIALYQYYEKYNNSFTDWLEKTVLETMRGLSTPRDVATLLRSILRHALSKQVECAPENQTVDEYCRENLLPYLNVICRPILQSSRHVRQAFVQLSILSSSSAARVGNKSDRVFCHCVALLLASCKSIEEGEDDDSSDDDSSDDDSFGLGKPTSVLERSVNDVASCWTEAVFVQRTNGTLQHHVTNFILSAIPMLDNKDSSKNDPLSSLMGVLLNGVSARLQSSNHDIRRDGMRVGEAIAKYIGQPLQFDEIKDEHAETSCEHPVAEESVAVELLLDQQAETTRKKHRRKRTPKQIDPDAEYISDDESSSNSSEYTVDSGDDSDDDDDSLWDDSDELIPYNLDDDEEDLRETAVPLYLRDCLDMLRTPDTNEFAFSRHETAVGAVSNLVRSNPADLPDLTVPLCIALVAFENKTDLPKLETNLATSLVSLTVMQPVLAGEFLIKDFFGGGHGLDMRLLVLRTLEEAAYELCGEKALKEGREKSNSESRTLPKPRTRGKRGLVPDTLPGDEIQVSADRAVASFESRTRRWGGASRQSKPVTVVNKFGPIAPAWFYALVSGFLKHKDDTALWGGANGAHLLANFLIALATIVECSGLVPGTEILARDLCEFAWSFRSVDVPEVRTAVLIAIANSLAVLRDEALMSVLYGLNDLPEYLRGIALEDGDKTCRTIATTISTNVSQLLGNMMDSRSIES